MCESDVSSIIWMVAYIGACIVVRALLLKRGT
jgi:hypothetical protein